MTKTILGILMLGSMTLVPAQALPCIKVKQIDPTRSAYYGYDYALIVTEFTNQCQRNVSAGVWLTKNGGPIPGKSMNQVFAPGESVTITTRHEDITQAATYYFGVEEH